MVILSESVGNEHTADKCPRSGYKPFKDSPGGFLLEICISRNLIDNIPASGYNKQK